MTQNKEKMIIDVNVILVVEKKKKKQQSKPTVTINKEITEVFIVQKGNPCEVVEGSSIMNEVGGMNVEIHGEEMTKPLLPIMEEVKTQLIE